MAPRPQPTVRLEALACRSGGSPLSMPSPALPCSLADRAVFWAELGVVSAPRMLSRVGRILQDASDEDLELREAMCLAAKHVSTKCLVWNAEFSQVGDGAHADEQDVCSSVSPRGTLNSDYSSEDSDGPSRSLGAFRLLPAHCWVKLLPGLGGLSATLVWIVCFVLGSIAFVYQAFHEKTPVWLWGSSLSSNVTRISMGLLATKLLLCIPVVIATASLAKSDVLDQELDARLNSASGENLRSFMHACTLGLLLVFAVVITYQEFWLPGFGRLYRAFVFARHLVHFVSSVLFLLIWKLSVLRIDCLRDRVRLRSGELKGCWPQITREYHAAVKLVDGLWRKSGFSFTHGLIFFCNAVFIALWLAFMEADDLKTALAFEVFCIGWQTTVLCVGLYLWAKIHSRCASSSHAKGSLLYLGNEHLGRVCRQDTLDHLCFLRSVEELPCGVEIRHLGLVSGKFVAPLLRVVSICIPVIIGVVYRVSHSNHQAAP